MSPITPAPGASSASDYEFDLPPEAIAQAPAARRADARLMLVAALGDAARNEPVDAWVRDLPALLHGDEVLVVNDTRVVPARLHGHKPTGGHVELLVLGPAAGRPGHVLAMGRASKPLRGGTTVELRDGSVVRIVDCLGSGRFVVALPDGHVTPWALLDAAGELPLPPYIARPAGPTEGDRERYQTVFADAPGSVAAPTAGLHLTHELLAAIRARGCEVLTVTLHVGPGTFLPIRAERLDDHVMHAERYAISPATAQRLNALRAEGRPVLAVGTTAVRTLESAIDTGGHTVAGEGETSIFIRPGHRFAVVRQLMTNFHLPGSTLLVLVSALTGRDRALSAYTQAVERGYRFYSYGDAMLIR